MIVLDRSENDTSVALDFMRAAAAQIVCIGHALNFAAIGPSTLLPNFGVVLFFLISGFVIAATLSAKSADPSYGPIEFGIDRFARIYTAYLPALVLIAVADYSMAWSGHQLPGDSISLRTLFGNLVLRENMPAWPGVSTFGSAGHLTSVALEFHIYLLVGAVFFLLKARAVWLCIAVIFFVWQIPASYAIATPRTDRALFIVWLVGFAAFYIASATSNHGPLRRAAVPLFAVCFAWWAWHRTDVDAELINIPALGAAFLCLVIITQQRSELSAKAADLIRFFADYSYSLFLIHLTIIKLVYALPLERKIAIPIAIIVANAAAVLFALAFERHYRMVASAIKVRIRSSFPKKDQTAEFCTPAE
ncbi:acyltransferase [Bradyrhizobium sp. 147]|uniref:acyltransferase family protein n=1 Tax=Bradyrhizobium sp. 147 TaxID=2782623 RepID=UPI001FFA3275|nr:acyltransferase [Bradyrhizobium sp. 147]MCK1681768.1 acyltransferase [Bradyrhizobium sp. 147]